MSGWVVRNQWSPLVVGIACGWATAVLLLVVYALLGVKP